MHRTLFAIALAAIAGCQSTSGVSDGEPAVGAREFAETFLASAQAGHIAPGSVDVATARVLARALLFRALARTSIPDAITAWQQSDPDFQREQLLEFMRKNSAVSGTIELEPSDELDGLAQSLQSNLDGPCTVEPLETSAVSAADASFELPAGAPADVRDAVVRARARLASGVWLRATCGQTTIRLVCAPTSAGWVVANLEKT